MVIYLKVKPNQRFNRIEKLGEEWQVRVKAPATEGKANEDLITYLSEVLCLSKSKVKILKGHTARIKAVEIDESEQVVLQRLHTVLDLNRR
jgi:hypothetical protein